MSVLLNMIGDFRQCRKFIVFGENIVRPVGVFYFDFLGADGTGYFQALCRVADSDSYFSVCQDTETFNPFISSIPGISYNESIFGRVIISNIYSQFGHIFSNIISGYP